MVGGSSGSCCSSVSPPRWEKEELPVGTGWTEALPLSIDQLWPCCDASRLGNDALLEGLQGLVRLGEPLLSNKSA